MNMNNKNNKGRGEKSNCSESDSEQRKAGEGKYGYPTSIVLRKVAGMGVMTVVGMVGVLAVGFLWGARGAEAA